MFTSPSAITEILLFAGEEERTGEDVPPRSPLLAMEPLRLLAPEVSVPEV